MRAARAPRRRWPHVTAERIADDLDKFGRLLTTEEKEAGLLFMRALMAVGRGERASWQDAIGAHEPPLEEGDECPTSG